MMRIWIAGDDLAGRECVLANPAHEFAGQEALPIILENNRVGLTEMALDVAHDRRDLGRGRGPQLFAIDPNYLLVASDDAGFHDGGKPGIFDGAFRLDLLFLHQITELSATAIGTEHPDDGDVPDEFAQIPRDIRGASRIK